MRVYTCRFIFGMHLRLWVDPHNVKPSRAPSSPQPIHSTSKSIQTSYCTCTARHCATFLHDIATIPPTVCDTLPLNSPTPAQHIPMTYFRTPYFSTTQLFVLQLNQTQLKSRHFLHRIYLGLSWLTCRCEREKPSLFRSISGH